MHDNSLFDLSADPKLYRVKSPMNYIGGKHDLLQQLFARMPQDITTFVDAFCGGLNVGANAPARQLVAVDCQRDVVGVLSWMRETPPSDAVDTVKNIVRTYDLGRSSKTAKTPTSSCPVVPEIKKTIDGNDQSVPDEPEKARSKFDQNYRQLRSEYNEAWLTGSASVRKFDTRAAFYALIVHSFNSQVRFGPRGYNIPFGERTFNDSTERNLYEFSARLRALSTVFLDQGYEHAISSIELAKGSYVYADPPYSITMAPYNTTWNASDDVKLFENLDELDACGVSFGLSNVFRHSNQTNQPLVEWSKKYHVHILDKRYDTASYNLKDGRRESVTEEVFVTNYVRD